MGEGLPAACVCQLLTLHSRLAAPLLRLHQLSPLPLPMQQRLCISSVLAPTAVATAARLLGGGVRSALPSSRFRLPSKSTSSLAPCHHGFPPQPMHACTPACCNAVATDVGYHILVKAGHRAWHVGHADRQPEKRRLCWGVKRMHACTACGNNRVPRLVLTQGIVEAAVAAHPQRGSSCLPSLSCCWALAWAVAHKLLHRHSYKHNRLMAAPLCSPRARQNKCCLAQSPTSHPTLLRFI